jgi:hypothetical protein
MSVTCSNKSANLIPVDLIVIVNASFEISEIALFCSCLDDVIWVKDLSFCFFRKVFEKVLEIKNLGTCLNVTVTVEKQ